VSNQNKNVIQPIFGGRGINKILGNEMKNIFCLKWNLWAKNGEGEYFDAIKNLVNSIGVA
jgi:hypothetical protein